METEERRVGRIVGELLEDLGMDNGCIFLPCKAHVVTLAASVLACAREGLKFTPVNVSLIAYGEDSEVHEAFDRYKGFATLHATLNAIFDGCTECQTVARKVLQVDTRKGGDSGMTTDRVGKVLERVAREIDMACAAEADKIPVDEIYQRVLEERLGPLLRAGQVFREQANDCGWGDCIDCEVARASYDAALATLEGRDGK